MVEHQMNLVLPDRPNCRMRIRICGGVGGALGDGRPYPDRRWVPIPVHNPESECPLRQIRL